MCLGNIIATMGSVLQYLCRLMYARVSLNIYLTIFVIGNNKFVSCSAQFNFPLKSYVVLRFSGV